VLSLYGSTRLWVARVVGALIAVPVAVAISPVSGDRIMEWNSPTVIGILPQVLLLAVLTRGIYAALVQQERTMQRESLLARTGHAMLGVTDVDRVRQIGVRAAEELVALNPETVFLVLRRRSGGLVVASLAGAPEELRGHPLSDAIVDDTAELTALMPDFREWHLDSLGDDPASAERYIAIGGRRRVPEDVVDGFRTLSHQVALAESSCSAHAELEHRADHDHLTELPTRSKFLRAVGAAVSSDLDGGVVALLNVDLDDFKEVNDGYGHATGDELLVQVAARLKTVADDRGMAARLGGDEFALLLTGLPDAMEADRIAALLCAQLTAPMQLTAATVTVGASIGIAVAEPGVTVADLTRRADIAMYSAKATGKNRIEAYRPTRPGACTLIGRHPEVDAHQPAV
jgi:diguanylate cyclase (GGDEF)-like protein